jgi:hypothetical protein
MRWLAIMTSVIAAGVLAGALVGYALPTKYRSTFFVVSEPNVLINRLPARDGVVIGQLSPEVFRLDGYGETAQKARLTAYAWVNAETPHGWIVTPPSAGLRTPQAPRTAVLAVLGGLVGFLLLLPWLNARQRSGSGTT